MARVQLIDREMHTKVEALEPEEVAAARQELDDERHEQQSEIKAMKVERDARRKKVSAHGRKIAKLAAEVETSTRKTKIYVRREIDVEADPDTEVHQVHIIELDNDGEDVDEIDSRPATNEELTVLADLTGTLEE